MTRDEKLSLSLKNFKVAYGYNPGAEYAAVTGFLMSEASDETLDKMVAASQERADSYQQSRLVISV